MTRRAHTLATRRTRRGFSLLELLVALAVFALAAAALLGLSAENTRLAAHLETRALAGLVADNLAVEAAVAPAIPQGGTGTLELAGRRWRWTQTATPTDDPGLVRIDIRVAPDDSPGDAVAAGLTLFREAAR